MSATELPGTPPEAMDQGLELVLPGRSMPAGAGWDWIAEGWRLFTRAPLMWIVSLVALFVLAIVVSLVPVVGSLAFQLLQAVFAGGFVHACRCLERGGDFEIEHLLAGFQRRFVSLLVVGVLLLAGWIAIFLVFAMFAGFSLFAAFAAGDPDLALAAMAASAGTMAVGALVMLALMVPLMAAYWFAPALVMMHDMPPVAAMKASLSACFRNLLPFLVYGLAMLVGAILAVIPFGLGFLVWVPVAIASTYVAYRQIFTRETAAAAPVT
jgi:uncharacterized membrane protein